MARIQNNSGITDAINRLINLLRGIAGLTNSSKLQKFTLAEELLILENYTEIISLRYMGTFEVINNIPETFLDCHIPQLTLQPLVENAIIHGIAPSGRFGKIILNAERKKEFLDITIEDTGVGINKEKLSVIKSAKQNYKENSSLNNIGIANVEKRLKMHYGKSCGLFFDSKPGEYTKVTIRIKAAH